MRKALLLLLAILIVTPTVFAEDEPKPVEEAPVEDDGIEAAVEDYTRLPETVVTVTRREENVFDVPRAFTAIPRSQIVEQQPRHAIDVITRRDAGVIMDMRTTTTGDPIMRGFAGFNILALVDGNTLSTLWGEGGFGADDMYGKIDASTIETIEIVRGPGSVLYGSNALGGVINFITRSSPIGYTDGELEYGGRAATTYQSNSNGWHIRSEVYGANDWIKGLYGVTYADYENGESADETLDPTSGEEINFDLRTDMLVAPGHEVTLAINHVYRHPTYRYYRPTQDNKNERWGVSLTWKAEELADGIQDFEWHGYYQYKRDQRRFKDSGKNGFARTVTWSTDAQASTELPYRNLATYGLHASVDNGEAPDDEQFKFTKPQRRSDSPDSKWANYAGFLQDEYEMLEDCLKLTGAVRYDYFVFNSEDTFSYQPDDGDRQADFFRDTEDSWTGGLAATWEVDEQWRVLGSWSRGFRQFAPNFGFRQLGNGVLVPNQLLDPVTSDNYEIGIRTRQKFFDAEGFVYYSDIKDWQALRPDTYDGSDWYDYNENGVRDANEDVISQQAVDGAYVWGFELKSTLYLSDLVEDLPEGFTAWGAFAWNRGKTDDHEYFRHTQPARGLVGLRWDGTDPAQGLYVEFIAEIVNRYHRIPDDRKQNDLAYREDPQDGDSPLLRSYGGVPGYTVYYLYAGMNVGDNAKLTLGIENLTDKKYRRAHSRMDAFGLNLIFGVEVTF